MPVEKGGRSEGGDMEERKFKRLIGACISVGDVLPNPSSGTSTITKIDDKGVRYRRGKSVILLKWDIFHGAYRQFSGKLVDTGDLEGYHSSFSRSKHYCNCTFALMLLERAGLADRAVKRGRRFSAHFWREPHR